MDLARLFVYEGDDNAAYDTSVYVTVCAKNSGVHYVFIMPTGLFPGQAMLCVIGRLGSTLGR